ncbi:PREDICTED: uncharacterized protein LOC105127845 [Populus euphratica]|uniref:beta-N-acetylhexosaminidase n=1 Tax=Populus euphratica TaxID=75702 RepID=A0AAJ6UDN6_POPEU|nr:PREDICTED: uncharacterized protein LOC105127845 [Populus euphratica]
MRLSLRKGRNDTSTDIHPAAAIPNSGEIITNASVCNLYVSVIFPNSGLFQLQLGLDESYLLLVEKRNGQSIIGEAFTQENTLYGALRGLEKFSQLCASDYETKTVQIYKAPWYNNVDKPRFACRGLLPTSRHYLPINVIKQINESMSYAKLNVLHWHIIDEQSFPLEVPSFPNLGKGSYTKWERYTVEDAYEIVKLLDLCIACEAMIMVAMLANGNRGIAKVPGAAGWVVGSVQRLLQKVSDASSAIRVFARDWRRSLHVGRELMLQLFTKQYGLEHQQVPEHVNLKPISSLGYLYIFNSDWFSSRYCPHCAWPFTGTARPFCNRLFRIVDGIDFCRIGLVLDTAEQNTSIMPDGDDRNMQTFLYEPS